MSELAGWARAGGAAGLVVALGVDAAGGDPESPLEVTADGYRAAGRALGELGLPTVIVQEGGYDLERIGDLVLATLEGFQSSLNRELAKRPPGTEMTSREARSRRPREAQAPSDVIACRLNSAISARSSMSIASSAPCMPSR